MRASFEFVLLNSVMNFRTISQHALSSRHLLQQKDHNHESLLQNQFIVDDVSKIIKESIEQTIGGNSYLHDKVNLWTGQVVESCLSVLTKQQKPYKYIGKSNKP